MLNVLNLRKERIGDCFDKSKHREEIIVRRKDGSTFTQIRTVGSEKEHKTKYFDLSRKFRDDEKKQERYNKFLTDLVDDNGSFYSLQYSKVEMRDSGGRSRPSRTPGHQYDTLLLPIEYSITEPERKYRNELVKKEIERVGKEKFDKFTQERKKLLDENGEIMAYTGQGEIIDKEFINGVDRSSNKEQEDLVKDTDELHKERETGRGKKLIEKEERKYEKKAEERKKTVAESRVDQIKGIFEDISKLDTSETTYRQLNEIFRGVRMFLKTTTKEDGNEINGNMPVKMQLKDNDSFRTGTLDQLLTFLKTKDSIPFEEEKPLFKRLIIST